MSKIGFRIIASLLVVSLIPLACAVLTFRWVMDRGLALGVQPEVETALELATVYPRKLHDLQVRELELLMDRAVENRVFETMVFPGATAGSLPGPSLAGVGIGEQWHFLELEGAPSFSHDEMGQRLSAIQSGIATSIRGTGQRGHLLVLIDDLEARGIDGRAGTRVAVGLEQERNLRQDAEMLHQTLTTYRHLAYLGPDLKFKTTAFFVVVMSLVMLGSLIAGLSISRGITRRVALLAGATERMARGDLSPRLPLGGSDELGQLMNAFSRMAGELRRSRERIIYLEKMALWKDMARKLAHEIKNPLSPIQLVMQELYDRYPESGEDGDDEYRHLLEESRSIVLGETARLKRMVMSFSAFARLPAPEPGPIDLNGFIAGFYDRHPEFTDDIELIFNLASGLPEIRFDPDQLDGLLRNLSENIVRLETGGLRGVVRTRPLAEEDAVELMVEDNGPGIPDHLKESVFEPSFSGRQDGMGLGLAIVKKNVLDHGGWISVEDSPGSGARFVIRFPVWTGSVPVKTESVEDDGGRSE